jgi:hypothetical protein
MNHIIDPSTFAPDKVTIPEDATQEQWSSIHGTILLCRKASRAWLKQSREWAEAKWGAEYVAEAEEQMELALGLPAPDPTPRLDLNPADKSKAIVTIEGISQQFALWHRKMSGEFERWDKPRLEKALKLIEPIETEAKAMRERLSRIA